MYLFILSKRKEIRNFSEQNIVVIKISIYEAVQIGSKLERHRPTFLYS